MTLQFSLTVSDNLQIFGFFLPCEQQVLIELAINSGDFW
jgi:hypothetical protein